jgi:hypothetical protein
MSAARSFWLKWIADELFDSQLETGPMNAAWWFKSIAMLLICCPAASWADQLTIGASKDNTIYQNSPTNSAGASGAIFSGTNNTTSPRRGLIAFDVAGSLPAGATITSASLTLYLGIASNSTPRSIELHRLTSDWSEGTAGTGSTFSGSGNGFSPADGGATWNEGSPGVAWTAGGNFAAAASASTSVASTLNVPSVWSSTPLLVSDVTGWYTNPATNFGWGLVNSVENINQTVKGFYSKDATQSSFRPALVIEFTVPEPATAALAAAGALISVSLLGRRPGLFCEAPSPRPSPKGRGRS